MLHFASLLCVLIDLCRCRRQSRPYVNMTKLTILRSLKMGPVLITEGESHQTKRYTHCWWFVKGNGAGRGRRLMGSGQTMMRLGRGSITYPTGQPSESWKLVETGTSIYVGLSRLTKLVQTRTNNFAGAFYFLRCASKWPMPAFPLERKYLLHLDCNT